jgi:hypothetical protein
MSAERSTTTAPAGSAAAATPSGSRLEIAGLLVMLALDLLSVPFHLLVFLLSAGRQRRAFRRTLEEAAS